MTVRPLIEQWFPAAAVGAESLRERGSAKAYPPINFLHVWWARRPLLASRAAVLASVLPAWPTDSEASTDEGARVRSVLTTEFPDGEDAYHEWFIEGIGILGDPVAARAAIKVANDKGVKLQGNGYGYDRAFTLHPARVFLERANRLIATRSSAEPTTVLDPFSGGGAIPFEGARLGFNTVANELNPVATAILHGTVALPAKLGADFAATIKHWGGVWADRVAHRLSKYFPREDGEVIAGYIWTRTVPCPTTGRPTPLIPSCALATGKNAAAVALHPDEATGTIGIEIVTGQAASDAAKVSTYKQGTGRSVWTGDTFDGAYIREMGQSGHMGEILLAVSVTRPKVTGRRFRAPSPDDLDAVVAASAEVERCRAKWEIGDVVPTEEMQQGWKTKEPRNIGVTRWQDMFSPRQLLTAATAVEDLRRVVSDAAEDIGVEQAKALNLYLAFAFDKVLDYNCSFSSWDASRTKMRNVFDRHDFAVKWSFAEMDGAHALIPWAVTNAVRNHEKICALVVDDATMFSPAAAASARVVQGSATDLPLDDASVAAVVTDPPYYDNVMYAELSDFFYVWLKRTLRDTWPELTRESLTDKVDEAVANPSLFKDVATATGRKKKPGEKSAADLADEHYEDLLTRSFKEAHRVLEPDGVMTVMFTHKRTDAWDTLGQALLEAGFSINSSWPVHTESEFSLHQANKNAAASTIFLTCRKRGTTEPAYWTDIRSEVARVAVDAAHAFAVDGMFGIDLTIATFGPVLSVLSQNWPVYTGELDADGRPQVIRPDAALDLAREEVARLKIRGLLGGRSVEFDRITDWYLLAWSDFLSPVFPFDEGRKLCLATHLEIEDLAKTHKLVRAASGKITLLTPAQRRTANGLDPDAAAWPTMIDALHALMLIYEEEGLAAAKAWLTRTGRDGDAKFHDLVEAAIRAVPRVMDKGDFARPEARALEGLRATLFDDIEAPADALTETGPDRLFEVD